MTAATDPASAHDFYGAILDSISACLCVMDRAGHIVYVNRSWREFGQCETPDSAADKNAGAGNYLAVCEAAAATGCEDARQVALGLRRLVSGQSDEFSFEYPCHSPQQERWFMLTARPLHHGNGEYFVLKHKEISDRKFHEQEIERLSVTDALTRLANRRKFEQSAREMWALHQRSASELSLVLMDIDHFKLINDEFGHPYGDECLRQIAEVVATECRRTNDLAARIGGEEIALLLTDTELADAAELAERIRDGVEQLQLEQAPDAGSSHVTVSLGVASALPGVNEEFVSLYKSADEALYQAKDTGRNRVCIPR